GLGRGAGTCQLPVWCCDAGRRVTGLLPHRVVAAAMVTAPAVTRAVLADQVRDQLLEWILGGRYEPDARIVETQVARELGTSQAPVREALIALEAVGIVDISPFRGARVRRPSRREILEAYGVRSALETYAARLAVPRMTDEQVTELLDYGEQMEDAARR